MCGDEEWRFLPPVGLLVAVGAPLGEVAAAGLEGFVVFDAATALGTGVLAGDFDVNAGEGAGAFGTTGGVSSHEVLWG